MHRFLWLMGLVVLVALGLSGRGATAQALEGDFGDAPDTAFGDRYPTRADTANADLAGWHGPVHLDTTLDWLGASVTREATPAVEGGMDASGAVLPGDEGDDGWNPQQGTITVTLAENAPDGARYLNVVADHNNSGHWNSTRSNQEWIVQNLEVVQDPGSSVAHVVPMTIAAGRWVRITLTREPILAEAFAEVGGWDGSGPAEGFAFGETEDYRTISPVRPPTPPVTIASGACGLVISVLNNLTWFRARDGLTLEAVQAELPDLLAQIEPLPQEAQPAIDAFFDALDGQDITAYENVLAATEVARANWTGCEQMLDTNLCGIMPYLYARFFSAPSVESDFVDELSSNYVLRVLGQSDDGAWLQVRMPNGFSAWVPMVLVGPYCTQ